MGSITCLFQLLSLFLISVVCVSALSIPKHRHLQTKSSSQLPKDLKTFYYTQRLDHFNFRPDSFTTFKQRYIINFKHWGGAKSNAPIFAHLGAEAPIDTNIPIGFLDDNAPRFNALSVYIEHRYYGKSMPFGSFKKAMKKATTRGYFNSAQAIADYAAVLLHIKKKLHAHYSPIIVIGGSYGGMLASWFRLKYPHIALGALASSAPILWWSDIHPQDDYFNIVTKDFKETSESCYNTIRKSWSVIDKVAKKPNGLSILSKKFKACRKLSDSSVLKDYLIYIYAEAAQYNQPSVYPVKVICDAIEAANKKTDVLGQIFEGVEAYIPQHSCYDLEGDSHQPDEKGLAWNWQTCSEMGTISPSGPYRNDSMFPPNPFDVKEFVNGCTKKFGILPQSHWMTTYYGDGDLKLNLQRFASNIIFSNGLSDPYSSGGVLESISNSVVAVTTKNGSHCLDLRKETPSDPEWLVEQRRTEVKIIKRWIDEYQCDLHARTKTNTSINT